jgi:CHAT domain-containing protein
LEEKGIDVRPVYNSVRKKRQKVAEQAGRFADAEGLVDAVNQALKGLPESHIEFQESYTCLGRTRAGRGDFRGAEQALNEAVRLFEVAREVIGTGTTPATFGETPYETRALVRLALGRPEEAWLDIESSRGRLHGEALLGKTYRPMPLAKIQASLSADEAIVCWVDHHLHYGGGQSWAYVLRDTGPVRWEQLPRNPAESSEQLGHRYAAFRDRVVAPGTLALGAQESDFPEAEARSLWDERLAPIERHLTGVRSLVVIPSSAMGGIPMGALVDAKGRKAPERWSLRYAPSATLRTYLLADQPVERPRSGLFVGDPPFRSLHLASAQPVHRGLDQTTVRGVLRGERVALNALPRLAWTRQEVQSIATLFPAPQVYVGEAATETTIGELARSGRLAQFDVIHLATHALMDGARPLRSALVLSQLDVQPDALVDGVLTAYEIGEQWKVRANLVTLSACETAVGRNILGEGTVGFAYPLMRAGAKSVLASLWSVNDESSELLMRRFYENWLGRKNTATPRMNKSEALREAQLWLRDWRDPKGRQPFRHPYYWSAFALIGD